MRKHDVKSKTADGKEFEFKKTYYYWDGAHQQVFGANWDPWNVEPCGSVVMHTGYRIRIDKLRENRNDALADGQNQLRSEIAGLMQLGERLESEKILSDDPDFPRRIRIDRFTPAEKAIYDAVGVVEAAGAHPLLTDAVILLVQAREKVADFVDGVSKG